MSAETSPTAATTTAASRGTVEIEDTPAINVRAPSDLVGVIGTALGIVLVCLAVIYAHNTTAGMAADVRAFAVLLQRILFVPVAVLNMAVILVPPIAVGADLLLRRHPIAALQALVGALSAVIVNLLFALALKGLGTDALTSGLSISHGGVLIVTLPAFISAITGLLTAVSSPARRRAVTWSWNLMWVAVVVAVVTATTSLPGMGLALLIGRLTGLAARYAMGVASQRAYGQALIAGVRQAGFEPTAIRRVIPGASGLAAPERPPAQFFNDHRLYVLTTASGATYNLIVLDGDRQVMGILSRVWTYLRSRGIEGRNTVSLRHTAERVALLTYAARSAGVTTPAVLAIAEAEDSMLIVRQAAAVPVGFGDLAPDQISDDLLDRMWLELAKARRCGLAHRRLAPDCFRWGDRAATGAPAVLGWESGDVASSDLAQRMDAVQLLALTAARVGAVRALAAASRSLGGEEVASLGPLLQLAAVPKPTRALMADPKTALADLRDALAQGMPDAPLQPAQITRVSARTVIMVILVAAVIIIILTSFNLSQIVGALRESDWRWAVAAFGVGLIGFTGSALTFVAFAPIRLSYWRQIVCQAAASFIAVAAPAGLGPAAVNLRVLQRKQVTTPLAVATAGLVQVTTVGVTILALVTVTAVTGSSQLTGFQITPTMLIVIAVLAAAIATVLIVPRSRNWVLGRVTPTLRQTWPRLVELFSSPQRLALGVLGQIIAVASYVTAMYWAILAMGRHIPFLSAAVVYLLGNSAGAFIPTPGGMGAIEVTESGALVAIGLNAGVATSIILLFRLVTYWIRIPLGWVAYRYARHIGEL